MSRLGTWANAMIYPFDGYGKLNGEPRGLSMCFARLCLKVYLSASGKASQGISLSGEVFRSLLPVDHVPECVHIVGASILIIQVVGMFPDVQTDYRLAGDVRNALH